MGLEPRVVALLEGAREVVGWNAREYRDGELGTDARDAVEQQKNLLLLGLDKAEEMQRVLADMRVDEEAHLFPRLRQPLEDTEGKKNLVADAADVDRSEERRVGKE